MRVFDTTASGSRLQANTAHAQKGSASLEASYVNAYIPTDPFTILEPRAQEIDKFYLGQKRATDFEAPEVVKGSAGLHP